MKNLKKIPKFKKEDEERKFWAKSESTDYLDYSKARKIAFTGLKPSTKTISIRLPEMLLNDLRREANKKDIPYQSLLKQILAEKFRNQKISRIS